MGRAGGGSSGGGHRSGGHSSSRSSGGHSVSSHRSGSSFSHSRSGSGSSYSRSSYNSHYHSHNHYGNTYYGGRDYNTPMSASAKIVMCVVIVMILFVIFQLKPWQPTSTRNREKLTDVPAFSSDCVVDELNWFDNANSAGSKLKSFYDKTGVQPFVYLMSYYEHVNSGMTPEEHAQMLFDELGLNENAFLYVYFAEENQDEDVGYMQYVSGKMVDSVMDDEAVDIFWAYVDKYWYTDMSTDDLFQNVFTKTGNVIMQKSKTFNDVMFVCVGCVGVCVVLLIVLNIMKTRRKHAAQKAAETERILNTPMQDLVAGSENDSLLNKYK